MNKGLRREGRKKENRRAGSGSRREAFCEERWKQENQLGVVKNRVESDRNVKSGSLRRQSGFMGKTRKLVKRPSSLVSIPDTSSSSSSSLVCTLCLQPKEEEEGGGQSESGVITAFFFFAN